MKLGILSIAIAIVTLSSCVHKATSPPTSAQPTTPTTPVGVCFPLSNGAYWVYEGTVKWMVGGEVKQKTLAWKMEVVETIARGPIIAYAMKGHPSDLAWYEEGKERSDYAIIQVGSNRFYQASTQALERIRDETDSLVDLINEGQVFLDFPLFPGKRFCDAEQITRPDGRYCWVVGQETQVALGEIKGILSAEVISEYTLEFITLPDHVIIQFAPGVGITKYTYVHQGTVSEVDVQLVEYHPVVEQQPIAPTTINACTQVR